MSWKVLVRIATLVALVFLARTSYAQGTCPSASNMDGGVHAAPSQCYYVDFAGGSDNNSGASESTPLKRSKGMQGCSSNCSGMVLGGGVGVIFKGGVTWDYTIWPWAVGGSGSNAGNDSSGGCTGSSCLYFGVDKSWFAGGSWSRPIFSGGDFSNPGTNTTCHYDMDNSSGPRMLDLVNRTDVIIDNFEFTGMCLQTPNVTPGGNNPIYINSGGNTRNLTFENLYFHRVAWPSSFRTLGAGYAAIGGGSYHYTHSVIDWTDSGATPTFTSGGQGYFSGAAINGGDVVADHNVWYNVGDATDINPVSLHDNYFFNAAAQTGSGSFHSHISNDGTCTPGMTVTVYNNVLDTVWSGQGFGFQNVSACTYYIFNNVLANEAEGGLFYMSGPANVYYFFNNTLECGVDGGPANGGCGIWGEARFSVFNNHWITGQGYSALNVGTRGAPFSPAAAFTTSAGTMAGASFTTIPGSPADLVIPTQASANGQGYSYRQSYMFSPTSASGQTVGKGMNETAFCTALYAATGDAAARTACKQDTTYAVTYNKSNHTVVASTRAPNSRPATGPWDVGAYQFSSATSAQPNPPSGLSAIVQ
jgi:hypothetical protein